ncbi:MlaD family protein [Candidatus Latescibacterota bacterium]
MATKSQKIRLSIFLIASTSILLLFFILLVGNRLLKRMDTYYVIYEDISVTGLEPGAAVKLQGVQVGRVSSLTVIDAASIMVEIEIERGTPIKENTEAILTLVGITGLKFIELQGGTSDAEQLEVGDTIIAGQSLFENITGQAEIILSKLEQVLNNLNKITGPETAESFNLAIHSIASLSSELDTLFTDNRTSMTNTLNNIETVMENLSSTSVKLDSTMTAINTAIQSGELKNTVSNIEHISQSISTQLDSLKLAETSEELRTLLKSTDKMIVNYDALATRARDDILKSLRNLDETLNNLREAADVIRENPSVLLRGRRTTGDRLD